MAAPTLHSLKFQFDIRRQLNPGDIIPSSNPSTEIVLDGPGGFPLYFTLQLIYVKDASYIFFSDRWLAAHWFLLRLHVEQPSDIPCLPPLHIQPMPFSLPRLPGSSFLAPTPIYLVPRLVGPQEPANWGFPVANNLGFTWTGEFRFQILDEPLNLIAIANLPPLSEAHWSCLPQDMVSVVLRELPLADLVSARLVCKEWKRILDTDSRPWSNVTHLLSIGKWRWQETFCGYHGRRLNQVRGADHKLCKALSFLTSRKAPINTLELVHYPRACLNNIVQEDIELFPSALSQHKIKLKAFSLQSPLSQDVEFISAVLKLIRSQPSLEQVYLETLAPSPSLLEALPRLRILSLSLALVYPQAFQTLLPQLCRLDGLRVVSSVPPTSSLAGVANRLAFISNCLASHNSDLRQVESVNLPWKYQSICGCRTFASAVVWGSGNLSPAAAAFLLMPGHYNRQQKTPCLHVRSCLALMPTHFDF